MILSTSIHIYNETKLWKKKAFEKFESSLHHNAKNEELRKHRLKPLLMLNSIDTYNAVWNRETTFLSSLYHLSVVNWKVIARRSCFANQAKRRHELQFVDDVKSLEVTSTFPKPELERRGCFKHECAWISMHLKWI